MPLTSFVDTVKAKFKPGNPEALEAGQSATIGITGDKEGKLTHTQRIRTELNTFGVTPTNYFLVDVMPPAILRREMKEGAKAVQLACMHRGSGAVLPGLQLNTSGVRRFTVGLEERNPISPIVVDQTFTFIGDRQGLIYNFFYRWMNAIITSNKGSTYDDEGKFGHDPNRYPGSVLYRGDYSTNIKVSVSSGGHYGGDNRILEVFFENAYPVSIGDVQLSWGDNDSYAQFPITFTYTHWKSDLSLNGTDVSIETQTGGVKDLLSKAASAALLISSLKKPRNIQDVLSVVNNAKTVIGGFSGTLTKFGG